MTTFENHLRSLRDFVAKHHELPTRGTIDADGRDLGTWVNTQRTAHARGELSADRATAIIEQIPNWTWDAHHEKFAAHIDALTNWATTHGKALPPATYRDPDTGFHLGVWALRQRQLHRRGELPADRIAALEAIPGWTWTEGRDEKFRNAIDTLRRFVAEHGRLPTATTVYDGVLIGKWVARRRSEKRANSLNRDTIAELEAIPGWTWGRNAVDSSGDSERSTT